MSGGKSVGVLRRKEGGCQRHEPNIIIIMTLT